MERNAALTKAFQGILLLGIILRTISNPIVLNNEDLYSFKRENNGLTTIDFNTATAKGMKDLARQENLDDNGCSMIETPPFHHRSKRSAQDSSSRLSWFVTIFDSNGRKCQGILIKPNMVLTAAHCFFKAKPNNGISTDYCKSVSEYEVEGQTGAKSSISHVYRNEGYFRSVEANNRLNHDIAIALLETPMEDIEKTICLQKGILPVDGSQCWAIGNVDTDGATPKVKNVDVQQCKSEGHLPQGRYNRLRLCVTQTFSEGHSGGPVMCENGGRIYLAGVMSQVETKKNLTILTNVLEISHGGNWLLDVLKGDEEFWRGKCPLL